MKEVKLANYIEEISMGPFGSDIKVDNFISSGVAVLNGSNLTSHKLVEDEFKYISEEKANKLGKANAKRGDIVITHRGTLGQVAYIPSNSKYERYVISQSQFRVRFKDTVDPIYFAYLMKSDYGQKKLLSFKNHVGVPALAQATTNFKNLELHLHDISEQQSIAAVLSSLDNKIELNYKINAELEHIARTLFDYWFVQFDFPNAKGNPYRTSGGKMIYNDVLKREVPEGWKVGNILCISDLLGGGTPSKKNGDYWNGEIPFFTPSDANRSVFSLTTLENITSIGLKESSTKLFSKGTIFLTARGSVGKIMIASREMAMNQSCYALKSHSTGYAFLYLTALNMVGYLKAKSSGSVFNSIVSNDIKHTPVLIPGVDVREKFEEKTKSIFEKILINLEQNQQLSSLRDWLLPMLINGQAKVLDNYALSGQPINIEVDPESGYQKTTQLNIPINKKGFAKQVLAGRIISLFKNDPHFTDIKFQKIQFLAEHIIKADLNLNYYYQAAGPYDNIFMHTIYNDLKKNKWYECKDRKFAALEKQGKIEEYYQNYFGPAIGQLDKLFSLLSGATEAESEIIATIYAVWNNFILEGKSVADDELIQSFYDWSERKHQYTKAQVKEGLQWLRKNHLEPTGFGKLIKKAKSKK